MREIPWETITVGIGGVAIMAFLFSRIYAWAIQTDPGGPFSGILSAVGVTGASALILLGGGLLAAVGYLFDKFRGDSM